LKTFGFEATQTRTNGELLMERALASANPVTLPEGATAITVDYRIYPRFYEGAQVGKFVVPIRPAFHAILFPEIAELPPLPLFPGDQFLLSTSVVQDRTPGNTIRKVYICRSPTRSLAPGDILLFYLSKSAELTRSQSVTTVGIVERVQWADSTEQLIRLVGRRSVYSRDSLLAMRPSDTSPVLVIDFLLSGHLEPHLGLEVLLSTGAFSGSPPQSIKRLEEGAYLALRNAARMSFE
jgi:hypothetical protein